MSWDFPLWLISGISLPLIVLLHLLARRRRTVVVPSLLLWERLLENERRSVVLRRMIADALLLLQLLAAALLVLTLAGPRPAGGGRLTGPTVMLIDVSAGMSAVSEDQSRLEEARSRALDMIRRKGREVPVMILAAGRDVVPLTEFTPSRRDLRSALESLEPTDEAGDAALALRTAEAMAAIHPDGTVLFFTDGAFDGDPTPGPGTRILPVGRVRENSGITAFSLRRRPGGGAELLVVLDHHGLAPRDLQVSVRLDGRELSSETVRVVPDQRATRSYAWSTDRSGDLTVVIRGEEPDALSADDAVYAVLDPSNRSRVALFTPDNWFLETFLTRHPNLAVDVFRGPGTWDPGDGPWDLVVADRVFPPVDPGGALLAVYPFTDTEPPPLPLDTAGTFTDADPVAWNSRHPVMRNADLSRVSIRSAQVLVGDPGTSALAESRIGSLVLAGEEADRRWLAFAFDLLDSSLPLRTAFPILMADALEWLLRDDVGGSAAFLRAGEEWRAAAGVPVGPDGATSSAERRLRRVGFWAADGRDGPVRIGVNLLDAGETDLRPRWEPRPDPVAVGTPGRSSSRERGSAPRPNLRPLAGWLLALACAALLVEWFLQVRSWRRP